MKSCGIFSENKYLGNHKMEETRKQIRDRINRNLSQLNKEVKRISPNTSLRDLGLRAYNSRGAAAAYQAFFDEYRAYGLAGATRHRFWLAAQEFNYEGRYNRSTIRGLNQFIRHAQDRRRNPLRLTGLPEENRRAVNVTTTAYRLEGVPAEYADNQRPYDKRYENAVMYYNLPESNLKNVLRTALPTNGLGRVMLEITSYTVDEDTQEIIPIVKNISTKLVRAGDTLVTEMDRLFEGDIYDMMSMDLKIYIAHYRPLLGGRYTTLDPYLVGRKGYYKIENDEDDLCGQRCIALGEMTDSQFKNFRKGNIKINKHLKRIVSELGSNALSFTDFDKHNGKQIVIMHKGCEVMYKTQNPENTDRIYLYHDFDNDHYHLITNIHTFTAPSTESGSSNYRWCEGCDKRILWKYLRGHKCSALACKASKQMFSSQEELHRHLHRDGCGGIINCPDCNMFCHGNECLKSHLEKVCGNKKQNTKDHRWMCLKCGKFDEKDAFTPDSMREHVCGNVKCENCETWFRNKEECDNHRCFIQKPSEDEDRCWRTRCDWYTYDFESTIDPVTHIHEVNMCKICDRDEKIVFTCHTLKDCVDWMLEQKRVTFIAHNAKAYDAWLIHAYLIAKTGDRPHQLILAGQKIMSMKIQSITFLDSINHLSGPLENLPKTLGFSDQGLKKEFFPYTFNTPENASYVGAIPDEKYFDPNRMKGAKRDEFKRWHASLKEGEYVWDHQKELNDYCESDVIILSRAMKIYQELGMEISDGIDPLKCVTVASMVMREFRSIYLGENTIAILKRIEYDFCKRGFYGGRTEAIQLYKDWTDTAAMGVYGKHIDIQSQYPSVQFYDELPLGEPRWIDQPTSIDLIGYYEVDITPPNDLYHPVLPERKDGKLIFDLKPKTNAVYASVELKKALDKGYKITKFHKAFVWDESSCDMFKPYVAKYLKLKLEASGFKGSEVELQKFIKECKRRFGFTIDRNNLKKNPGMKALAKMKLNSLWGKFGQKCNMSTSKYVTNPNVWVRMCKQHINGDIEITSERIIDENTIFVQFVEMNESRTSLVTTNVGLAGMITAQARLRLYKELDRLGTRVLYFDTDSIIYESSPNGYNTEEGDYLSEWVDETGSKKIIKFVAIGPKSYSYIVEGETAITKFKGFTLNFENSRLITFNVLKKMIDENHVITTRNLDFKKDAKNGVISTINQTKTAKFVYDKRHIIDKHNTLPFGHKDIPKID